VFDDLKPGARVRGLTPTGVAEIVQVSRFGADALNLVFRADGKVGERLLYRGEESAFEFVEGGRAYAFDADGALLRLASEASHISLSAPHRSKRSRIRSPLFMQRCCRGSRCVSSSPMTRALERRSWPACWSKS
jgi:hypothetical protein